MKIINASIIATRDDWVTSWVPNGIMKTLFHLSDDLDDNILELVFYNEVRQHLADQDF